jgi:hypothetical protein
MHRERLKASVADSRIMRGLAMGRVFEEETEISRASMRLGRFG